MSRLLEEVKKHRKEIKHEVLTYGISELVGMHSADPPEMRIQPEWQRLFRWSREQQSSFIESLVLEIPVPPLFFFENDQGQWELLDGLQRVSTIIKFMGTGEDVPREYQGVDCNYSEWHYEHQNDIDSPLQLVGTEYLPSLEGLSFLRLPTSLRLNLKRARLQIYVLKRETDRQYKYEVFKRLNRGGSRLEDQELRNCAVRIFDDQFAEFLKQLGRNDAFRACLKLNEKQLAQSYGDELALRFLAMKNHGDHFRHDVDRFLTSYMEQVANGSLEFDYESEQRLFDGVWNLLATLETPELLFRAKRADGRHSGGLQPTVFELVSLAVAWNLEAALAMDPSKLRTELEGLIGEAKRRRFTGAGSNSNKSTQGRLELSRTWKS